MQAGKPICREKHKRRADGLPARRNIPGNRASEQIHRGAKNKTIMKRVIIIVLLILAAFALPGSRAESPNGPTPGEIALLKEQASKGDTLAAYTIGKLFQKGKGVERNYAESMKWYLVAARKGYAKAEYRIGKLYEKGLGVTRDKVKAMEWYKKACDNGNQKGCEKYRELDDKSE